METELPPAQQQDNKQQNRLDKLVGFYRQAALRMVELPVYNHQLVVEAVGFRLWLDQSDQDAQQEPQREHARQSEERQLVNVTQNSDIAQSKGVAQLGAVERNDNVGLGIGHIGVVITPWFMSLIFFPQQHNDQRELAGGKYSLSLPGGDLEMIANYQQETGLFYSCSLFSPMAEFDSQEFARQVAVEVLGQVFPSVDGSSAVDKQMDDNKEQNASISSAESVQAGSTGAKEAEGEAEKVDLSRRRLFGFGRRTGKGEGKGECTTELDALEVTNV